MEILKGTVTDPGYDVSECIYAKMDDGQHYYFIKDGELPNQNVIATTILKEAIGHTPYTSLGLINSNGEVLIPFENKAINRVGEDLLLVEKNTPTSQSVLEALQVKSDSFASTNVVNTANTIKGQMKSVMGYSAEFIFDNPFSEAALYNIQGQNIGGAYFSFIGKDDVGNCYMSSNVKNSQIIKYDPSLVQNQTPEPPQEQMQEQPPEIPEVPEETTPVENAPAVPTVEAEGTIPEAASTGNNQEMESMLEGEVAPPIPEIPNIDIPIQSQVSNETSSEVGTDVSQDGSESNDHGEVQLNIDLPTIPEISVDNNNADTNENNSSFGEDTSQPMEQEVNMENDFSLQSEEGGHDTGSPEPSEEDASELNSSLEEGESTEDSPDGDFMDEENDESVSMELEDIENDFSDSDDIDGGVVNENSDTELEEDSMEEEQETDEEQDDMTDSDQEEYREDAEDSSIEEETDSSDEMEEDTILDDITNPVISSATNTIRLLLDENRKQREMIDHLSDELENMKSSNEILQADNESKEEELQSLRKDRSNFRSQNSALTRENNKLKAINERQSDIIDNLKVQNQALKEQVAGISALGSAVAEANTVMGIDEAMDSSSDLTYNTDLGYLDDADEVEEAFQKKKAA